MAVVYKAEIFRDVNHFENCKSLEAFISIKLVKIFNSINSAFKSINKTKSFRYLKFHRSAKA